MARDTLGYEYTGDDDTSRMPADEVDDDDIVDRLAGSSRICRRTRRAPYRSTLPRAHQKRLVAAPIVEYPFHVSSRTDELFLAG
jgi:hypothetical protein